MTEKDKKKEEKNERYKYKNPSRLFIECYKEHGLKYTIQHTLKYLVQAYKYKEIRPDLLQSYKDKRKLDVLFLNCPPWDVKMPPLGISYLSSNINNKGYKSDIIDMNIELYHLADHEEKRLWKMNSIKEWENGFSKKIIKKYHEFIKETITRIKDENPMIISFSVNFGNYHFCLEMAKKIRKLVEDKKIDSKIGIGGPNCDDEYFWKNELKDYINFELLGEGEIVIIDIIKRIKKGKDFEKLPGVIVPYKKTYVPKKIITKLDEITYPSFEEFHLQKYTQKTLPILGSRGCSGSCTFCSDWKPRGIYSSRKAKDIIKEIKQHIKNFGIKEFNFLDLTMNSNLKELEKFCDIIITKNIKIIWWGQGRINSKMSMELIKKMKKAGCVAITFGVESLSDRVLENMGKHFKKKDVEIILKRMKKAGIKASINIIVGFPGENEKEFMKTYNFLKEKHKLIPSISSLAPCMIFGNSDIEINNKKYGITIPKENGYLKWYKEDNTYEDREKRIKKIIDISRKKNIRIDYINWT